MGHQLELPMELEIVQGRPLRSSGSWVTFELFESSCVSQTISGVVPQRVHTIGVCTIGMWVISIVESIVSIVVRIVVVERSVEGFWVSITLSISLGNSMLLEGSYSASFGSYTIMRSIWA